MSEEKHVKNNRMVIINEGVVGPRPPMTRNVRQKSLGDYPGVPQAYLDAAKLYSSPLIVGPPICDELMELIQHMFTEEEASLVRHLKPLRRVSAAKVAYRARRPVEEVREILDHLAWEKFILQRRGKLNDRRYSVMPIIPGTFEYVLCTNSLDKLSEWQKEFARLVEALVDTGFLTDYLKYDTPGVRYLPVKKTIESHPMALPSDRLFEIMDRYDIFAVTHCQCRIGAVATGRVCDRPLENCVDFGNGAAFGDLVEKFVDSGKWRKIDKKEAMEIKLESEASGLVNWMQNISDPLFISSCSCCGCCCHMMRNVTEYNMPAAIAPPHFRPKFDLTVCDSCAKCARRCPMGAITVDMKGKTLAYQPERCVGCGQCVLACDKKQAVKMDAVANYKEPPKNNRDALLQLTPNALRSAWSAWRLRS